MKVCLLGVCSVVDPGYNILYLFKNLVSFLVKNICFQTFDWKFSDFETLNS